MNTFDREQRALADLLKREGWPTYTDRASDRGGPTKGGVTLRTLQRHKPGAGVEALQALTLGQASAIYLSDYLAPFAAIEDDALWSLLVDYGVTSGPKTAIKALQQAVQVPVDGFLGRVTAKAANDADPEVVRSQVTIIRLKAIGRLVTRSAKEHKAKAPHCQGLNCEGWINRFVSFLPAYGLHL